MRLKQRVRLTTNDQDFLIESVARGRGQGQGQETSEEAFEAETTSEVIVY